MSAPFGGSHVYLHTDGTECLHRLARDSEAPEGLYCAVTHSDVMVDDGGPRTGRITVVLNNDDGRFFSDVPFTPIYPPPLLSLPSKCLGDPPRGRHIAEQPGMFDSWPHALWMLGVWAGFSGLIVGVMIGLVWVLLYVLK